MTIFGENAPLIWSPSLNGLLGVSLNDVQVGPMRFDPEIVLFKLSYHSSTVINSKHNEERDEG